MRTNKNLVKSLLAGLFVASLAIAPATSFAQRHDDRHHGNGNAGNGRVWHSPGRGWQQNHGRDDHWRDTHWNDRNRWSDRNRSDYRWRDYSPQRDVHIYRYPVTEWRRIHPNWNGRYYYRGGNYYYDSLYSYPAVVDNEWLGIADIAGAATLLGALDNDPTLFFAGAAGELYSLYRYDQDLRGDRLARLRASYFSRPYFWRDGTRYDRVIVTRNGERFYRFVRH